MQELNMKLTSQEANILLQLIDLAVKGGGIAVAEAAVVLSKKINAAFPEQSQTEQPQ